jgi:uncharacterized protein (TIGR02284 family)
MANTGTIGQSRAKEGVISALQDLSARAHDSEQGYRRSAQDASDSDLKQQFERLAEERSAMAAELDRLLRENGGEPGATSGGSLAGAAHRMWTDLRAALSGNNRQAILAEVARGESAAEEAYDDALRHDLPIDVRQVVREQHRRVRETRNRYRSMAGTRLTKRTGELAQRLSSGTETVTHYMHERPVVSGMVMFAFGFVVGALTMASISGDHGYRQSRRRFW